MAPRKEKKDQVTGGQGKQKLVAYIVSGARALRERKANGERWEVGHTRYLGSKGGKTPPVRRPVANGGGGWQATDISVNLHNAVTKAKLLKEMYERGEIEAKTAGKQSVYHVIQDPRDAATPEELAAMDKEIEALRDEIATLKAKQKALHSTLTALRSTPTTSSLRESIDILDAEVRELEGRLVPLRSGKASPVSAEEKAVVDGSYANAERKSTLRKKIFKNLWDMTCDNLPEGTNKDELWG
ncbi:hypothetical protein FGG08_003480 [Glutinoglossum americanum]|uniref:Homologous-pairing protein 2 winged helix domain-containing protein n=1 Tax=Glutinoglossum americanum TaxID=1670608 RepID=A0A9P8I7L1_9PEZI|nr:hypothetical protein FGG08_003480 [Glutinoglossum americanum]